MNNPFETDAPDYQAAYLRLVDKIYRTGLYYTVAANNWRAKFNETGDVTADSLATSLDRCAADMDFIFEKATHLLPYEEVRKIKDASPMPFRRAS